MATNWAHVPLVELFQAHGVPLKRRDNGTYVGPHAHQHASNSGECLVVWPADGNFYCSSCRAKPESTEGGRRVSVLKRQEGAPVLLG